MVAPEIASTYSVRSPDGIPGVCNVKSSICMKQVKYSTKLPLDATSQKIGSASVSCDASGCVRL